MKNKNDFFIGKTDITNINNLFENIQQMKNKQLDDIIIFIYTTDFKSVQYGNKLPDNAKQYIAYRVSIFKGQLVVQEYYLPNEEEDDE